MLARARRGAYHCGTCGTLEGASAASAAVPPLLWGASVQSTPKLAIDAREVLRDSHRGSEGR